MFKDYIDSFGKRMENTATNRFNILLGINKTGTRLNKWEEILILQRQDNE